MLAARVTASAAPPAGPLLAYLRLEVRRSLRNRRYLVFTVAFPVILYVMYTAILPDTAAGPVAGLAWPVYFLVSMASYGAIGAAMSQAVPTATERRQGWARQLRVTPLPGPAYVAVKVVSAVLLTVPALVLVTAAGQLVNHLGLGLDTLAPMIVAIALGALPFAAIGLLIGELLEPESAQGAMVLTFFGMAILGGLFAPLETMPDTVATIGRVLPSSHLASVGRAAVAGRVPDAADVFVLGAWTIVIGVLAAWRYVVDERSGRA